MTDYYGRAPNESIRHCLVRRQIVAASAGIGLGAPTWLVNVLVWDRAAAAAWLPDGKPICLRQEDVCPTKSPSDSTTAPFI